MTMLVEHTPFQITYMQNKNIFRKHKNCFNKGSWATIIHLIMHVESLVQKVLNSLDEFWKFSPKFLDF